MEVGDPDSNQQVLEELRRLRRLVRRASITGLVILGLFVGPMLWQVARENPYDDVNRALRAADYREATQIAEKMAAARPRDFSTHEYLGNIYLRSGDLEKAEEAYARAYALYAAVETKTILEQIRKTRSGQTGDPEQEKYDEQTRRWDMMLDKYEEQNRRFDALLDKWEKQRLRSN